ncbi:unnamed protein product [Boreogadus saida]
MHSGSGADACWELSSGPHNFIVEGGFLQGVGLFTLEELRYSPQGALLTQGPGTYKIPAFGDIPSQLVVSLLRDAPNDKAVYSSKVPLTVEYWGPPIKVPLTVEYWGPPILQGTPHCRVLGPPIKVPLTVEYWGPPILQGTPHCRVLGPPPSSKVPLTVEYWGPPIKVPLTVEYWGPPILQGTPHCRVLGPPIKVPLTVEYWGPPSSKVPLTVEYWGPPTKVPLTVEYWGPPIKAVGEPPLFLAASVLLALKDAVVGARSEAGLSGPCRLDSPATPERVRLACQDRFTALVGPPPTRASGLGPVGPVG